MEPPNVAQVGESGEQADSQVVLQLPSSRGPSAATIAMSTRSWITWRAGATEPLQREDLTDLPGQPADWKRNEPLGGTGPC
jgi:hypothetical protein